MRRTNGIVIGLALALALAGCGGGGAPAAGAPAAGAPAASTGSTPAAGAPADAGTAPAMSAAYTSAALPDSYDNALPAGSQLALGILRLEGAPQAVTPAQARELLPLVQAFQGNALQNQAEQNAVLAQIEDELTPDQLQAIAAMRLTQDDLRQWAEESGMQGVPPGMTGEQRAANQATVEASGGQFLQGEQGPAPGGTPGAGGGPGNMTDEQRAAFRATVEASGGQFPRARGTPGAGGPGGQVRFFSSMRLFVGPLVELLTERAAG